MKNFLTTLSEYTPAMLSGFLLTMSFPKADLSWLAWVALVPLILSLYRLDGKLSANKAFKTGFVMGICHFLCLIYWIVPTISVYGQLPLYLAVPILLLLAGYLALYPAVFAWGINLFGAADKKSLMPLTAALLWVCLEYIRSILFTGFPWGLAGYSQYMNLNLVQIADITSVYGVSFIIVLTNGVLSMVWITFFVPSGNELTNGATSPVSKAFPIPSRQTFMSAIQTTGQAAGKRETILWAFCLVAIFSGLFSYGKIRIASIEKISAASERVNISVVQGNIEQVFKWDEDYQESTITKYCQLSRQAAKLEPDLIVWPETALPFYYSWNKKMSAMVDECIKESETTFLIGSPAFRKVDEASKTYDIFNRAYMINKLGVVTGSYDKVHLVPFGEYVPFGRYLSFLGKIIAQSGDFSSGKKDVAPLAFNGSSAGVQICFEMIFPYLSRVAVKNGAQILITMTNDAWFGYTSAPWQHFTMATFRAIENRRAVARAANTGISGFIDPSGKILQVSNLFEERFLTNSMPSLTIKTIYSSYGDFFAFICLFAIGVAGVLKLRTFLKNSPKQC
ncbi:MAG: apolipoprotein N-acyltransferase [Desulfamplus sp.]|nr:apolipoprotein N-acyltransferase [Desulfamplus sp.]